MIDLGTIDLGGINFAGIDLGTIDFGGGGSTFRRPPDYLATDFNDDFRIDTI